MIKEWERREREKEQASRNDRTHKEKRNEFRIRRIQIQIGTYIIIDSSVDAIHKIATKTK